MTSALINLSAVVDTLGGTANAPIRFTAQVMRGGQPAIRVAGAVATVPAKLVAYWTGTAWTPAQPALTDIDPDCYWLVELIKADGSARLTRTVTLPPTHGSSVNFADLIVVDPATLTPTPSAVAGWAATQALAAQVQAEFAALVAGAPSALDTFLEVSQQFVADESGATALAALVATKAPALTTVAVKTANYSAGANEIVPCDTTAGTFTVTLPTAPADKTRVIVKLVASAATPNPLALVLGGSDVFNKAGGSTTGSLSLLNQAIAVQYAATGAIWTVVGDDLPLSQLDSRYLTPASAAGTYLPLAGGTLTAPVVSPDGTNLASINDLIVYAIALGGD